MNENRQKAFDDWWLFTATPSGRMTPSAIWDAACDWMKGEILKNVDFALSKETEAKDE